MIVTLLGPGDISKIWRYTNAAENEVRETIDKFGKFLAVENFEVALVPSRGIHYEIAKTYKENGGTKVWGIVPKGDQRYGTKHIEDYLPIADEIITKIDAVGNRDIDWYDLNGEIASFGDAAVCFGVSAGSMLDMAMSHYHYKYLGSKKPLFVFRPFVEPNIPKVIEDDLKYLVYAANLEDLKAKLMNYREANLGKSK